MRRRSKETTMKRLCAFLAVVLSLAFAGVTLAQDKPAGAPDKPAAEAKKDEGKKEEAKPAPTPNKGDVAWMLTSTALVLMMSVPALALFYGGMVRSKNALSMLMQVFVVFSLVTVLWCIYGYSLAFIVLWFTFSYTPVAHMVWFWMGPDAYTTAKVVDEMNAKAGLLWQWGALDFAGGTVVHINSGIAGLVGAYMIGKRIGFGKEAMPPHNLTLTMIGAALLWTGWFGFNAGSALEADGNAALAFMKTYLPPACAVLSWIAGEAIFKGKPSMLGAASGAVAGLVAITPAAGNVGIPGAFVIGTAAGIVCLWGVNQLKRMLGADDSLDVFGVHAVGGILGALLTGVFCSPKLGGPGYVADWVTGKMIGDEYSIAAQLLTQAKAVGVTVV